MSLNRYRISKTVIAVLIIVLSFVIAVTAKNITNKKIRSVSAQGNPSIAISYPRSASYQDAYLLVSIKDDKGIDNVEIINLSTDEAIRVNVLKTEPILIYSDKYWLKDIFSTRRFPRDTRIKVLATNTSGKTNSLTVTLKLR